MSTVPTEAWILAGELDGIPARPAPQHILAGMPHLLRHACAAKSAGAKRIYVVWTGAEPDVDVSAFVGDERLAGVSLEVTRQAPGGDDGDRILVLRGDRVFHRDLPKRVANDDSGSVTSVVRGSAYDSVLATTRACARSFVGTDNHSATILELRSGDSVTEVDPPWLGFSMAASDRRSLRRAEGKLVSSLRKAADGFAATLINRHISLLFTRVLAMTSIRPNHVTVFCFISALSGAFFIARGDYWGGVIGFLLVELGSILDGIDGELSRLKYWFSRLGQWMDTVTDDVSNVIFIIATIYTLDMAGVSWALPVGGAALIAFLITQGTQYYFIAAVYDSGDLAAIPWAFQSTEFLESRPKGVIPWLKWAIPRCLKRDFVVTLFVVLALLGRLDLILLIWSVGSLSFLVAFAIQFAKFVSGRSAPEHPAA